MALNIFNKSFGNNDITDALPALNDNVVAISEVANGDAEAQALANELATENEILNTSVEALECLTDAHIEHIAKLEATQANETVTLGDKTIEPLNIDEVGIECYKIQLLLSNSEGILGAEKGSFTSYTGFGNNSASSLSLSDYRAGVEGLGDIVKKVKDKVVAFFKYIWEKIKQFWNWITGKKAEENKEKTKEAIKEAKAKPKEEKEKIEEKINSNVDLRKEFNKALVEANLDVKAYVDSLNITHSYVRDITKESFKLMIDILKNNKEGIMKAGREGFKLLSHIACSLILGDRDDSISKFKDNLNKISSGTYNGSAEEAHIRRINKLYKTLPSGLFNKYKSKQSLASLGFKSGDYSLNTHPYIPLTGVISSGEDFKDLKDFYSEIEYKTDPSDIVLIFNSKNSMSSKLSNGELYQASGFFSVLKFEDYYILADCYIKDSVLEEKPVSFIKSSDDFENYIENSNLSSLYKQQQEKINKIHSEFNGMVGEIHSTLMSALSGNSSDVSENTTGNIENAALKDVVNAGTAILNSAQSVVKTEKDVEKCVSVLASNPNEGSSETQS